MIRAGERSAREVLEAHIDLLARARSAVNPIAVERFEQARADADGADTRIAAAGPTDWLPPLLGVPFTVKELINVAGLPHTAGLAARRCVRATTTATAVQRLLKAGAILLGLTNTSELALWFETENPVYGRTSNPYLAGRTAGGSSGGDAAAVGLGGSPIGLGTDTGGSLRVPAFFCGVFAHKPSVGLVPQTLEFPRFAGHTRRMITIGPIVRAAEDLLPVLATIAGPDGIDPLAGQTQLGDPATVPIHGLRVLISERAFISPINPELLAARERAAGALIRAGAQVDRVELPQMRRMLLPALATLTDGGNATLALLLEDAGAPPLTLRRALDPRVPHTAPLRLWALAEHLMRYAPRQRLSQAIERGRQFAAELAVTIGDGVLLHPPAPNIAPRHRHTYGRLGFFQPASIFNLAGAPVTQVPLGIGSAGLPLGVQVVAAPGRDHATIAAALELERAFGGWQPPARAAG